MTKFSKFIICLTLSLSFSVKSFCQLDTTSLYERAKFLILTEHFFKSAIDWKAYLDKYVVVKELQSNGFSKTRFLLLQYRPQPSEEIPDSLYKKNEVYYNCDYVVAAYGGLLFRLKGFVNNDFFSFLTEFSETSDTGYLLNRDIFKLKSLNAFKTQSSIKNIFIEDLDMVCLYQYFKAQDEAYQKTKNISCFGSCTIKDRKRPYQIK